MYRDNTKIIKIGNRIIGGGNPVLIQSMTNTRTDDIKATVNQIQRLTEAGCEIVRCTVPDETSAKALKEIKKEISIPLVRQMTKYNVAPKSFSIRKMKTRWGSCSRKGSISLNLHLIKLPEPCIKEVILHELCHLVHFNHSKEFYALMTAEMPDWKLWKKELRFV